MGPGTNSRGRAPGWETSPDFAPLRRRARDVIAAEFGGRKLWGWKDPRTCVTLPFWQRLLPRLHYVICLRNPIDIARSLEKRDGFALEKSIQLWFDHFDVGAEAHRRSTATLGLL